MNISYQLDYVRLAELHRPTDESALACQVRVLTEQGLTERDIGAALRLDPAEVRRLLASSGSEAAAMHAAAWSGPRYAHGGGR